MVLDLFLNIVMSTPSPTPKTKLDPFGMVFQKMHPFNLGKKKITLSEVLEKNCPKLIK